MSAKLAPAAPRITSLIRLLGSSVDGEVLAAAHALRRTLQSIGADFHDLAEAIAPHHQQYEPSAAWMDLAAYCARFPDYLSPRERSFIRTMAMTAKASPLQQAWLRDIARRLREEAA